MRNVSFRLIQLCQVTWTFLCTSGWMQEVGVLNRLLNATWTCFTACTCCSYPLAMLLPPYIEAEDDEPVPKNRYGIGTSTYMKAAGSK